VLAKINGSIVAVTWDNGAVWMKMVVTIIARGRLMTVVMYLWAVWAVSYGAFSNNATIVPPIAMESHLERASLIVVVEFGVK
jgi:hypothetical protein